MNINRKSEYYESVKQISGFAWQDRSLFFAPILLIPGSIIEYNPGNIANRYYNKKLVISRNMLLRNQNLWEGKSFLGSISIALVIPFPLKYWIKIFDHE